MKNMTNPPCALPAIHNDKMEDSAIFKPNQISNSYDSVRNYLVKISIPLHQARRIRLQLVSDFKTYSKHLFLAFIVACLFSDDFKRNVAVGGYRRGRGLSTLPLRRAKGVAQAGTVTFSLSLENQ